MAPVDPTQTSRGTAAALISDEEPTSRTRIDPLDATPTETPESIAKSVETERVTVEKVATEVVTTTTERSSDFTSIPEPTSTPPPIPKQTSEGTFSWSSGPVLTTASAAGNGTDYTDEVKNVAEVCADSVSRCQAVVDAKPLAAIGTSTVPRIQRRVSSLSD
jgi:hypothetical protein